MVFQLIRITPVFVALALLPGASTAMDATAMPPSAADAMAQASPDAIAEYRRKLREYEEARAPFDAYWNSISEKRRGRNAKRRAGQQITLDDYVLTQPPVYTGPKKPVDPSAPERPPRKALPMVPDLIQAAVEQFQFTPQKPATEVEFKRAYVRVAAAAGLTRERLLMPTGIRLLRSGAAAMPSGAPDNRSRSTTTY